MGVVKDFHYGTLQDKIEPMLFRNAAGNFVWVFERERLITKNWPETFIAIEKAWKKVDKVHLITGNLFLLGTNRGSLQPVFGYDQSNWFHFLHRCLYFVTGIIWNGGVHDRNKTERD